MYIKTNAQYSYIFKSKTYINAIFDFESFEIRKEHF